MERDEPQQIGEVKGFGQKGGVGTLLLNDPFFQGATNHDRDMRGCRVGLDCLAHADTQHIN